MQKLKKRNFFTTTKMDEEKVKPKTSFDSIELGFKGLGIIEEKKNESGSKHMKSNSIDNGLEARKPRVDASKNNLNHYKTLSTDGSKDTNGFKFERKTKNNMELGNVKLDNVVPRFIEQLGFKDLDYYIVFSTLKVMTGKLPGTDIFEITIPFYI